MHIQLTEYSKLDQALINEICNEENKILTEFEFYKVGGKQKFNSGNKEIKRPILITYKLDKTVEKKLTYLHEFPHSESGKHSLTYKII